MGVDAHIMSRKARPSALFRRKMFPAFGAFRSAEATKCLVSLSTTNVSRRIFGLVITCSAEPARYTAR